MKQKVTIVLFAAMHLPVPFFGTPYSGAGLQAGSNVRVTILPSSRLTLKGTSTLHDFECSTTTIRGDIEMDPQMKSFEAAEVTIPVKVIHSESTSMDDNMYDALKAKEYPEITFSLLPPRYGVILSTGSKRLHRCTEGQTQHRRKRADGRPAGCRRPEQRRHGNGEREETITDDRLRR
jgi:hypothetical protein